MEALKAHKENMQKMKAKHDGRTREHRIRVLMLENNIKSVADLGRKVGMSRQYINGLMNAETKLDKIIQQLES